MQWLDKNLGRESTNLFSNIEFIKVINKDCMCARWRFSFDLYGRDFESLAGRVFLYFPFKKFKQKKKI